MVAEGLNTQVMKPGIRTRRYLKIMNELPGHMMNIRVAQVMTKRVVAAVSFESRPKSLYSRLVEITTTSADPDDGDSVDENRQARGVAVVSTTSRSGEVDAETLARRWGIGVDTARKTIRVTTQAGVRNVIRPVERRYRTRQAQLKFPSSSRPIFSDTMFPKVKSLRGHTCAQVFTDTLGWDHFYPMKAKSEAGEALSHFVEDTKRIPNPIVSDGALEERGAAWKAAVKKYQINQRWTEPYSPWQNRAEDAIREIKKAIKRHTRRSGSPKRLWCFLGEWVTAIRRLTAHDRYALDGMVPETLYRGGVADISEYCQFGWYEEVWYVDPGQERNLGWWIGVATEIGEPMTYWVLGKTAVPLPRSTVIKVLPEEKSSDGYLRALKELDDGIHSRIGDHLKQDELLPELADMPDIDLSEWVEDEVVEPFEPEEAMPEADEDEDPVIFDKYLGAEINLNRGGQVLRGRVVGRKRDNDGNPVGRASDNPLLDTREYLVEFVDGSTEAYTTNLIAEAMYSQVDEEGHLQVLMEDINDHRKDGSAVPVDDGFMTTRSGRRVRRRTTKGWELNVQWKDGSSDWVPLKDLKESYPVQVAEYAVANKLAEEPAFAWWISDVLKKRDRIISKVKSRYWK